MLQFSVTLCSVCVFEAAMSLGESEVLTGWSLQSTNSLLESSWICNF